MSDEQVTRSLTALDSAPVPAMSLDCTRGWNFRNYADSRWAGVPLAIRSDNIGHAHSAGTARNDPLPIYLESDRIPSFG